MDALGNVFSALSSDWRNTIEEILALAAIILALVHARHLRKQLDRLEEVRRALPTQYLGKFPEFIDDIVKLVKSAKYEIMIFCDFPGYGVFSNFDAFLIYTHILEQQGNKDVQIRLACLDTPLRRAKAKDQFAKGREWSKWLKDEEHLERVTKLLKRYHSNTDPTAVTREEIIELLGKEDERVLADTFSAAAEVSLVTVGMPLYFWLVDGSRAIFVIPGFRKKAVEHGYSTQDPHLIEGLLEIRERYLESAIPAADIAVAS